MAFEREVNDTKNSIGDIEIVLFVPETASEDNPQIGRVNVQIVLSDGTIETRSYNLLTRLQDDAAGLIHSSNLADLRDYLITRLQNEVLPLP